MAVYSFMIVGRIIWWVASETNSAFPFFTNNLINQTMVLFPNKMSFGVTCYLLHLMLWNFTLLNLYFVQAAGNHIHRGILNCSLFRTCPSLCKEKVF